MHNRLILKCFLQVFLISQFFLATSHADIGTASRYSPPYSPTMCYGSDVSQFPTSNLFAAAGDGIWDNGAACGRQYLVKCISASMPDTCLVDNTIQIRIVEYAPALNSISASADGTTFVLSNTAFESIANSSADSVNVVFQLV